MAEKYLTEAFEELNILNEDTFEVTPEGVAEIQDFVNNDDLEEVENIIDPLAETEEDLQDSYVGKVILDCVICQSKIYKDPEEVTISEDEDLVNIGEVCPYCQSSDGYKVIGQVAEYHDHEENEEQEPNKEDIKDKLNPEENEENLLKEDMNDKDDYRLEYVDTIKGKEVYKFEDDKSSTDYCFIAKDKNTGKYSDECPTTYKGIIDYIYTKGTFNTNLNDWLDESLKEDLQNVSVETDKETVSVSADGDSVKVETNQKNSEEDNAEMIAPIEPETEDKFEIEKEEEPMEDEFQDVDIDEFDEEDFDELGEKYLRRVYENVKSYKTVKGSTNGNKLKLEGIITFKSGKKAKTNFVFEAKTITKTGKLKFLGENKQFAKGKKAFTLTGRAKEGKLIAESLTYNYRAKDNKTGASKKLYGTVLKTR